MALFVNLKDEWHDRHGVLNEWRVLDEVAMKEPKQKCRHINFKESLTSQHHVICRDCGVSIGVRGILRLQNERIKKLEEALANFIQ